MSLLSRQVYANATTPLWAPAGSGGGGGSNATFTTLNISQGGSINLASSVNTGTQLAFYKDVSGTTYDVLSMVYYPTPVVSNLRLCLQNEVGQADTVIVGDVLIAGTGTDVDATSYMPVNIGFAGTSTLGIRQLDEDGNPAADYITFSGSNMDLSNVSSINGVPYVATPATLFASSNAGGDPVLQSAPYIATSQSFLAPANGKLFIQSVTNVNLVPDAPVTGKLFLTVNGATISNSESWFSATTANSQRSVTSITSFPVTGLAVYDISACVQGTDSTKDGDIELFGTTLFLSFSPQ